MAGYLLALFALLASSYAYPALATFEPVGAEVDDYVSLLQAEVVTQSRTKRKVAPGATSATAAPKKGSSTFCQTDMPQEQQVPIVASQPLSGPAGTVTTQCAAAKEAPTAGSGVKDAESFQQRSYLAYLFNVLVLLLIVDGVRRMKGSQSVQTEGVKAPQADHTQKDGWKVLFQAMSAGDVAGSRALLSDPQIDLNRKDAWGCKLLHAAAKGGSYAAVEMLLAMGAGVHERDAWDETPLHFAARAGHSDVCGLLLDHEADINAQNAKEWTPLVSAAAANREATCEFLLAQGAGAADLSVEDQPPLLTCLFAAQESKGSQAAEELAYLEEMVAAGYGEDRIFADEESDFQ